MNKEEAKIWKEGYESGHKAATREEDSAIKIGRAILDVLDNRYEFAEEDY